MSAIKKVNLDKKVIAGDFRGHGQGLSDEVQFEQRSNPTSNKQNTKEKSLPGEILKLNYVHLF